MIGPGVGLLSLDEAIDAHYPEVETAFRGAWRGGDPFPVQLTVIRGTEAVVHLALPPDRRPPVGRLVHLAALYFGADKVIIATDDYVVRSRLNPATGAPWRPGEIGAHLAANIVQGIVDEVVRPAVVMYGANRAGDVVVRHWVWAETGVGREIAFTPGAGLWSEDLDPILHAIRREMLGPTAPIADLPPMYFGDTVAETSYRDVADVVLAYLLAGQVHVGVAGTPGTPRWDAINGTQASLNARRPPIPPSGLL